MLANVDKDFSILYICRCDRPAGEIQHIIRCVKNGGLYTFPVNKMIRCHSISVFIITKALSVYIPVV